ncbi:hypothetical protein [Oenococcus kitaharae]|nr:hypothetical protein [Oenococcus kitaharae]
MKKTIAIILVIFDVVIIIQPHDITKLNTTNHNYSALQIQDQNNIQE